MEKKRSITKLKHPLPSYEISFEKHFEIIKAYIVASKEGEKPVSWKDFQNLVSFSPKYVSANNKFLEDLGLIKESEKQRGKYAPTPEAIDFSKIRDWDEEQAKSILRKLVLKTWFWESTKQLLSIRQKITKDDLVKKLGLDAGADPNKHQQSLYVVIEYLKYVGLIREENGTIMAGEYFEEKTTTREIKLPEDKDMIQIEIEGELYAIDVKELENFVREKGKKLNRSIQRVK